MEERRLDVQQIAKLANVSRSVVNDWLKGSNPHDLLAVADLAKALGVPFKSLLLGLTDEQAGLQSVHELYDEVEFFGGLCRVSITKLVPRNARKT